MSTDGDDTGEMLPDQPLDELIDTVLAGFTDETTSTSPLRSFRADVLAAVDRPPPPASSALATILTEGLSPAGVTTPTVRTEPAHPPVPTIPRRKRRMAIVELLAGSALAKALLGVGIAAAATTGAGAAGIAPEPVNDAVTRIIDVVTPFETDRGTTPDDPVAPSPPAPQAVDGPSVAEAKRDGDTTPATPPSDPGTQGLERANETPAEGHAPTSVPSGPDVADEHRPADIPGGPPSTTPAPAEPGRPSTPPSMPEPPTPAPAPTLPTPPPPAPAPGGAAIDHDRGSPARP
jgi:hypothetical protein